jgi:hypothetical protein
MHTYRLAFRDQPARLLERLKPALVSQGDPPIFVVQADDAVEFTGGGESEFMLQARAAEALTDVWPEWRARVAG